jgi:hypothetical protein
VEVEDERVPEVRTGCIPTEHTAGDGRFYMSSWQHTPCIPLQWTDWVHIEPNACSCIRGCPSIHLFSCVSRVWVG